MARSRYTARMVTIGLVLTLGLGATGALAFGQGGGGRSAARTGGSETGLPGTPQSWLPRLSAGAAPWTPGLRLAATSGATTPLPPVATQIKVLRAALARMHADYRRLSHLVPGPEDVFDYGVGDLWLKGIDGAGTTVAVIEGWDYAKIGSVVANFDKQMGLPNPQIETIYPSGDGKLPAKCPPGMVKLGNYGSCKGWAGELVLDVLSAHLMAPYAKILISVTPADSQESDDPASNVAPPEMMQGWRRSAPTTSPMPSP